MELQTSDVLCEHKQSIATTYGKLVDGEVEDVDERLLQIREQLQALLGKASEELDFYWEPLAGTWGGWTGDEDVNAVDGLELKKGIEQSEHGEVGKKIVEAVRTAVERATEG